MKVAIELKDYRKGNTYEKMQSAHESMFSMCIKMSA